MLADVSIALGLLAVMLLALEVGYRAGRRAGRDEAAGVGGQVGAIQGAVLGLLGLLLAFSFAAAGSRFLERQELIAQEANALGTSSMRANLLDEPQRSDLLEALSAYAAHRLQATASLRHGLDPAVSAEVERLHDRIWRAASQGVARRPEYALAVLNPVNEVVDLHSLRAYAGLKRLPALVLGLLIACSLVAVAVIGYGCGMDGLRRRFLTWSLVLLISSALWITIDLDQPRRGLLQLDDSPLRALKFEAR